MTLIFLIEKFIVSVLKGMNYLEKATARKRNGLVGGHNA